MFRDNVQILVFSSNTYTVSIKLSISSLPAKCTTVWEPQIKGMVSSLTFSLESWNSNSPADTALVA